MSAAPAWLAEVASYWAPPPLLSGSEWAPAYRVLGLDESPKPGAWQSVTWQRGILDAMGDPSLDWVVVLKAAQMGCSELVRCAVGRWAMLDPGDVLWVMATELAADKAMRKLRKMFTNSPELRKLVSSAKSDNTLKTMTLLNGMRVVIGWSGSPQSLASDPFRYIVLDETGKYAAWVGAEADPVELAKERTKVYGRRAKVLVLSTPAHQEDLIMAAWEETLDQQRYALACASCQHEQPLQWEQTRWEGGGPASAPADIRDRLELAALVEEQQSAWVACVSCGADVGSAAAGWIRADLDGHVMDVPRASRRRAFHISELYHWETSPSDLVAKFLRRPIYKLQGFFNGSLGIPARDTSDSIRGEVFRRRAIYAPGVAPPYTVAILATADTQLDHFWLMVRAWGSDGRSRLLDWGRVESFEELEERGLRRRFPVEGSEESAAIRLLLVDSGGGMDTPDGSRTHQVYQWTKRRPRALPYKGDPTKQALQGKTTWRSKVTYSPAKRNPYQVELVLANANFWKDRLAALILAEDPVLWEECIGVDAVYARHMSSQHKVTETRSGGAPKHYWKKRSKHARKDLWDCAYMQAVAAEEAGIDRLAPVATRPSRRRVGPWASDSGRPKGEAWKIGR